MHVVEIIILYSMRSCTLSQRRDLRMWSRLHVEGDLTGFEEDNSTKYIAVVKSGVNKRCADGASRIKVENRTYATKITDVVETCTREKRDLIREGKMRIESETNVF